MFSMERRGSSPVWFKDSAVPSMLEDLARRVVRVVRCVEEHTCIGTDGGNAVGAGEDRCRTSLDAKVVGDGEEVDEDCFLVAVC